MKLLIIIIFFALSVAILVVTTVATENGIKSDVIVESQAVDIESIKKLIKERNKTFKIDQISSNHTLIRETLIKRGYSENKKSRRFNIKWSWCWEMLKVTTESQIVNHFINHQEIGSKSGLTKNMNRLYGLGDEQLKKDISQFFPRSYILSNPNEKQSFILDFKRSDVSISNKLVGISNNLLLNDNNNIENIITTKKNEGPTIVYPKQNHIDGNKNIWIVKPNSNARGVGIQIFDSLPKLLEYTKSGNDEFIVQKYIESPYTIKNTKFDIRQFVLVKSLNPLVVFKFRECYLRFCSIEYSTENLDDRFVHLSNFQVQKEYLKDHTTPFPENQWSLSTFKDHLIKENDGTNIWEDSLDEKIKNLIITTIKSWPSNGQNKGSFELLGFDILLSDRLDPLLLEVNTNPGLHLLTENVKIHHKIAIDDLFKVVLDNQDKWDRNNKNQDWIKSLLPEEQLDLFGQWEPIYVGDFDEMVINLPIAKSSTLSKKNQTLI